MNDIELLRKQISEIDADIIGLIAFRQQISKRIGEYKKQHNLSVIDPAREALLHEFHRMTSIDHGVSPELSKKVFEVLIEESRKVQTDEQ
ncbi:MAG: chorismate mutase [Burkholderiales bacterium]|jgi:chorismate mutase|nr:chorismate mutase [Burkholderiales bacterium]